MSLLSDSFWCVFEVAFCYSASAHSPLSAAVENTQPCSAVRRASGFHVNSLPAVLAGLNQVGKAWACLALEDNYVAHSYPMFKENRVDTRKQEELSRHTVIIGLGRSVL